MVVDADTPRPLVVGSKTMPTRNLAMNLDVDEVLEDLLPGNLTAALMQQWGEEVVDLDVGLGTDPELARMKSYSETWEVPMHAEIVCKRGGVFDLEREMDDSATIPVGVVWLGVGQEPGDGWRDAVLPEPEREPTPPEPADVPLKAQTWVTQAHLSVIPDPADPCRLNLSGVVVANGETDVEYRFVDELGLHTQQSSPPPSTRPSPPSSTTTSSSSRCRPKGPVAVAVVVAARASASWPRGTAGSAG